MKSAMCCWALVAAAAAASAACDSAEPTLSRTTGPRAPVTMELGQFLPARSEREASGAVGGRIRRGTPEFKRLVRGDPTKLVFKNEERTGADQVMSPRLQQALGRLADLVAAEWSGVQVRVTEAWDEDGEHGPNSLHYEGRAADITTSDLDSRKLSRLAALAVQAGFDWVYYESPGHVHVSVR